MDQNPNNPYNNNPYGNNPYGNGGYPYSNPYRNNPKENSFVNASFVLSIIAMVGAIIGFSILAFVPAGLAIVFAILSKGRDMQFPNKSRTAVLLSIAACIIAIVVTAYAVYTIMTNPEMMRQFDAIFQQFYGMTFEEMIEQAKNGTLTY